MWRIADHHPPSRMVLMIISPGCQLAVMRPLPCPEQPRPPGRRAPLTTRNNAA